MKKRLSLFSLFLLATSMANAQSSSVEPDHGYVTGGVVYENIDDAIAAALPGATLKMYQDAGFVLLERAIELDMNGHNIDLLHIRNQNGTVAVHDGTISDAIDGQAGDYTAYCGIVVLENMVVPGDVWIDGHIYYIKSGTYGAISNHRCADRYGTAFISGNNTYVRTFDIGSWDYNAGEIILLGGVYTQDPTTNYKRVFVDPSRSVTVLDEAPESAPDGSYIYQIVDDGSLGNLGIEIVEEENNNELFHANYLSVDGSVNGELNEEDSDDWFKVIVPEEGCLNIGFTSSGTLEMNYLELSVIDENGDIQQRGFSMNEQLAVADLQPGNYYIHLNRESGNGSYSMSTQFTACSYANDAEPNDIYTVSQAMELDKLYTGRMGYEYWLNADSEDWYSINIDQDCGVHVQVIPEETLNIAFVALYSIESTEEGQQLAIDFGGSLSIDALPAGTYYIEIRRFSGYGGYSLLANIPSDIKHISSDLHEDWGYDLMGRKVRINNATGLFFSNGIKKMKE